MDLGEDSRLLAVDDGDGVGDAEDEDTDLLLLQFTTTSFLRLRSTTTSMSLLFRLTLPLDDEEEGLCCRLLLHFEASSGEDDDMVLLPLAPTVRSTGSICPDDGVIFLDAVCSFSATPSIAVPIRRTSILGLT